MIMVREQYLSKEVETLFKSSIKELPDLSKMYRNSSLERLIENPININFMEEAAIAAIFWIKSKGKLTITSTIREVDKRSNHSTYNAFDVVVDNYHTYKGLKDLSMILNFKDDKDLLSLLKKINTRLIIEVRKDESINCLHFETKTSFGVKPIKISPYFITVLKWPENVSLINL